MMKIMLALSSTILLCSCSTTRPFLDVKGEVINGSIADYVDVEIGGVKQSLYIRGINQRNPILLFIHGGPGTPYDGLAYKFQEKIEQEFIVVHWAQRGAGKSYRNHTPKKSITFEQSLQDAHEVMLYLTKRFGKEKVYLLGHSWGSYQGLYIAQRHPELIHVYIGAAQGVDFLQQEILSHQFVIAEAEKRGDKKVLKKMGKIGQPPYSDLYHGFKTKYSTLTKYGAFIYGETKQTILFRSIRKSKEYTFFGYVKYGLGLLYHYNNLLRNENENVWNIAPINEIKILKVPVYFIHGKHDVVASSSLLEKYYNELNAPGKSLEYIENSGHFMFLTAPEAFCNAVIKAKAMAR